MSAKRGLSEALHDLADQVDGAVDFEEVARRVGRRRRRTRLLVVAGVAAALAGLGVGAARALPENGQTVRVITPATAPSFTASVETPPTSVATRLPSGNGPGSPPVAGSARTSVSPSSTRAAGAGRTSTSVHVPSTSTTGATVPFAQPGPYGFLIPTGAHTVLPLTSYGGPARWAKITDASSGAVLVYKLSGGELAQAYLPDHTPNPAGVLDAPTPGPVAYLAPCTVVAPTAVSAKALTYTCAASTPGMITQGKIVVEPYPQGYRVLQVTLPQSQATQLLSILNSLTS